MAWYEEGFFKQAGDTVGDALDSLTGATNRDLYQRQLDAQNAVNNQIFQLEQQRIAQLNSPEYKRQQTFKLVAVVVLFMGVIFIAYKLLVK